LSVFLGEGNGFSGFFLNEHLEVDIETIEIMLCNLLMVAVYSIHDFNERKIEMSSLGKRRK
jgi:hypothetical protein